MSQDRLFGPIAADLERLEEMLLDSIQADGGELAGAMLDLVSAGGKRIRPALVLLCGRLGEYDFERLAPAAIAVEITHAATLIHDDVIDRAELRRGRPTAAKRLGDEAAIVLGDHYFAKAYEFAAHSGDAAVVAELARSVMAICAAELSQQRDRYRYHVGEAAYFERIRGKTASLLAASCWIGGHLGGLDRQSAALRSFGENLGVAFQIADDLLDYTADEAEVGKPVGHDLADGHATLPLLRALRERELPLLDGTPAEPAAVAAAVAAVRESPALDAAEAEAWRYAERARADLRGLPAGPALESLGQLADYVVRRRR